MNYARILIEHYAAEWYMTDNTDYDTLVWLDETTPKPTREDLESKA